MSDAPIFVQDRTTGRLVDASTLPEGALDEEMSYTPPGGERVVRKRYRSLEADAAGAPVVAADTVEENERLLRVTLTEVIIRPALRTNPDGQTTSIDRDRAEIVLVGFYGKRGYRLAATFTWEEVGPFAAELARMTKMEAWARVGELHL